MKKIYIDCSMGASGDMLMSALSELLDDPLCFIDKMNSSGLDRVAFRRSSVTSSGVTGAHISVIVDGIQEEQGFVGAPSNERVSMSDIERTVSGLALPESVRIRTFDIYKLLAEAESFVHKTPVTQVHFTRLGRIDAIADIAGVCTLFEMLSPDRTVSSPVEVGYGEIRWRNGTVMPVPSPAAKYLLRDIPYTSGALRAELCTPTGAALLRYFSDSFEAIKDDAAVRKGYGFGSKVLCENDYVKVLEYHQ